MLGARSILARDLKLKVSYSVILTRTLQWTLHLHPPFTKAFIHTLHTKFLHATQIAIHVNCSGASRVLIFSAKQPRTRSEVHSLPPLLFLSLWGKFFEPWTNLWSAKDFCCCWYFGMCGFNVQKYSYLVMTRGEDNCYSRTLAAPLDPNFWDGEVISSSSLYRIIMIIINNFFVILCHVLLSPTQVLTLRYNFSPLPGVNVSCFLLLCASVTHTFVCSPNHQKKEKCWHFDRSFDSIFYIYIKCRCGKPFRSQRWPACCVSRPSGMWAETPLNAARRENQTPGEVVRAFSNSSGAAPGAKLDSVWFH